MAGLAACRVPGVSLRARIWAGGTTREPSMGDAAYRVLGLLVQARFQLAACVAIANLVFLLLEVHLLLEVPTGPNGLGLLDSPLLLAAAVLLIAQLPPGVLFRAAGAAATPRDAL